MTNLMFSQIQLEKIKRGNEDWFAGNEAAMDSIFVTYNKLKSQLSYSKQLELEVELFRSKFERSQIEVQFYKSDNEILKEQNKELHNQLGLKDDLHELDVAYYKERSKRTVMSFLYGTAFGMVIITVITLL